MEDRHWRHQERENGAGYFNMHTKLPKTCNYGKWFISEHLLIFLCIEMRKRSYKGWLKWPISVIVYFDAASITTIIYTVFNVGPKAICHPYFTGFFLQGHCSPDCWLFFFEAVLCFFSCLLVGTSFFLLLCVNIFMICSFYTSVILLHILKLLSMLPLFNGYHSSSLTHPSDHTHLGHTHKPLDLDHNV